MTALPTLSVAERVFGLSRIWESAHYNFAFFGRVPDLDWDAAYQEYLPQVMAAEGLEEYYEALQRFVALLQDGHSLVLPPEAVYLRQDRPKLALMRIAGQPVVTNVSETIARSVPIGSVLLAVDGAAAGEYCQARVVPVVCETTARRRLDHATARLLLGPRDSQVTCVFRTPQDREVKVVLARNRRSDEAPWLRLPGRPDRWEFMYFDEWFYGREPFTPFEFRMLAGDVAYVALHSFMYPGVVGSFEARLPALRRCAGVILDLRSNHGGNDSVGYGVAAHFLRRPTAPIEVRTQQHNAGYRAAGVSLSALPGQEVARLDEGARTRLRCYRHQWFHEESWGRVEPAEERLDLPVAVLTSSETGSAAEDFLMALESGGAAALRVGGATGGSTGQPLIEGLPGGGSVAVCTVQMNWPAEVWRDGIVPHVSVEPAVEDVMRDEDRALVAARRQLLR